MNPEIEKALQNDLVVDITTTGRNSDEPRRIEIWLHPLGDHYVIAGSPGTRDWLSNMKANPAFTVHLKKSVTVDLPARAQVLIDPEEKHRVIETMEPRPEPDAVDEWIANSAVVEVRIKGSKDVGTSPRRPAARAVVSCHTERSRGIFTSTTFRY
jgi:deazaflavin-dependent oxidoreductase (nitroreductase family)